MENTLENKQKFFAQYWGQNVYTKEAYNGEGGLQKVEPYHFSAGMIEEGYLQLKPISSITDEDATEVAKIYFNTSFNYPKYELVKLGKEFIHDFINYNFEFGLSFNILHTIDYLISKGYALPYNGLSVEEQIEYKWVKITN